MPCHSSGRPVRTRGAHPSEKTTFRVISGTFPQGRLTPANPLGGAGSARPQRGHGLDRGMWPVGRRPFAYASSRNEMPGHPEGRTTRTHRVRPSEKTTLNVIQGFPPQGYPTLAGPPPGGAGSARPQSNRWPHPSMSPVGHWVIVNACGENKNVSACVRPSDADAQSASLRENRLSRYPRACSARPPCPRMVHPAEGRAPHARKDGMTQTRTRLFLVVAQWHAPGDYDMPRLASSLTTRTRRGRPSEKIALRVISGPSTARPS
jgi:hypothetical protein